MKVLFICDDLWHPAEVLMNGMRGMDHREFQFDFVTRAKEVLTPQLLGGYPVVVNARGNPVTPQEPSAWFEPGEAKVMPEDFQRYVEEGGGFLSLHAGNSFRMDRDGAYCRFVGNSFVQHPPCCPVTAEPVGAHPIAAGVGSFTEQDEQYQLDCLAPDREVFLETVSESGGRQTAGYTRLMGKGRICVLAPGHTSSMLKNPHFRRLLSNALSWCARGWE